MAKVVICTFIGGIGSGAVVLFLAIYITAFEVVGTAPRATNLGEQLFDSIVPTTLFGGALGLVAGLVLALIRR